MNKVYTIYEKNDKGWHICQPIIVNGESMQRYRFLCVSQEISILRQTFLGWGMRKVGRQLGDPPEILETWV